MFFIALDIEHTQRTSYMDVQICFCTSIGMLINAHVIAPSFYTNKTAETQFNTACKALDAMGSSWPNRIVYISMDSEQSVNARFLGVET